MAQDSLRGRRAAKVSGSGLGAKGGWWQCDGLKLSGDPRRNAWGPMFIDMDGHAHLSAPAGAEKEQGQRFYCIICHGAQPMGLGRRSGGRC